MGSLPLLLLSFLYLMISPEILFSSLEETNPAAGSPIILTEKEKSWLHQGHTVRVRIINQPPYIFKTDPVKGISVDFIRYIAKKSGFKVDLVTEDIPLADALEDLSTTRKHYDLILTLMNTPGRRKIISFTQNYIDVPWVIITRDNAHFVGGMRDLAGKRVAVERNYVIQDRLVSEYPDLELYLAKNSMDALTAVATFKADAYIGNIVYSTYNIREGNLANLKIAAPASLGNHKQAMAVRKDWPELVTIINKVLQHMPSDEYSRITRKYFSVRYEHGLRFTDLLFWVLLVLVTAGIILGIILYWNAKLKELNERLEYRVYERTKDLEKSEEVVRKSLSEKTTLLRELYHRTKNNMQVVSSMLSLRALYTSSSEVKSVLQEASDKIHAMSLVHKNLYNSQNLSNISIHEYVLELVDLICGSYSINDKEIIINVNVVDFSALIDIAIPIGLIIHELLSNACKHAFPDNTGTIDITIEKNNEIITMEIGDDGIGVPEDFNYQTHESLGLQTIIALVEKQLDGSISFSSHDGLVCHISFADTLYEERV